MFTVGNRVTRIAGRTLLEPCNSLRPSMSTATSTTPESITVCNVYVSEGHDDEIISALKAIPSQFPGVKLAYSFTDRPYNRSSFTILGQGDQLSECVVSVAKESARSISLRAHVATHPRLGVLDHIACHHLGEPHQATSARSAAIRIAAGISRELPSLPVILYGDASPQKLRLQDIRRACGYFRGSAVGRWSGLEGITVGCEPQHGPHEVHPDLGICTVGSCPLILNYNIHLQGIPMTAARRVAKQLGERGGGLRSVETAALPHADGLEIACNLLDTTVSSPDAVLQRCRSLVAAEGGEVASSYRIGLQAEGLSKAMEELGGST